jgi:hypothetical protein
MKKTLFLLLAAIMLTASSYAKKTGKTDAPPAVQSAFAAKFPNTQNVKWEKEKNNTEYEANFTLKGVKTSANFTTDGKWVETETTIKVSELPAKVVATIKAKHTGAEIVGAAKIETASNGIHYEADIKKDGKTHEVTLDADGKFVK